MNRFITPTENRMHAMLWVISSRRVGDIIRCAALLGLLAAATATLAANDELKARLKGRIDLLAKKEGFSGAVLVMKDGQPLLREGYGKANYELDVPNHPETKFRLGSVTKQFTAMALMILAERGKLSTDDPIGKHLQSAPAAWDKITIRHLLTHTSGIPSYTGFPQ